MFFTLFLGLFSLQAKAGYIFAPFGSESFEPAKRTHVVVVSHGSDLGMAPQLSATTKVLKLRQIYPADQIVLFSHAENDGNLAWLKRSGFQQAILEPEELTPKILFNYLSALTQIVSVHTYGHSAIPEGVFLGAHGEKDIRLYPSSKEFSRLVGHFTSDAFVTLNGCNLGHQLAPMLARLWKVPVAGALVGTHFEVMMNDGFFAPLSGKESTWSKGCGRGCLRMRPDNANYDGHYGKYSHGLSFYKFFCIGLTEDECDLGMSRATFSAVTEQSLSKSSSEAEYLAVVREWLCPIGHRSDRTVKEACMSKLVEVDRELETKSAAELEPALRSFTPYFGRTASCDMQSCYQSITCTASANSAQSCAQSEMPKRGASTLVDEYLRYRHGFALLKAANQ